MSAQKKGILFSILGGVFWGISGVCGQYLFDVKGLNAKWMVNIRLIIAGILMLVLVYRKAENRKKWKYLFLNLRKYGNFWRCISWGGIGEYPSRESVGAGLVPARPFCKAKWGVARCCG